MKHCLLIVLAISGLSFAYNDALPGMMDARYDYASCDVSYAKDWLTMREGCADDAGVPVFDSSEYAENLDSDLADMREAADEPDGLEFGLASFQLGADSLELIGEVVRDAFTNKTPAFFSCVRDGEKTLIQERDDCRADALEKEKAVAKDYVNNEIDAANGEIGILKAQGADASGMEDVVALGEELVDDIDSGYDSGEVKQVTALHLRHSRLVFLFRAEQMLAVINYAEPKIEAGSNDNREEILSRGRTLRGDLESLIDQCEYSDDVDNNFEYGRDNLECWDEGLDLMDEFNSIRMLILEGA